MTRVHGGVLAAIGVIGLGITPFIHYARPALRTALHKVSVIATAPTAAAPDCASTRSKKDVRVVGHTITNKVAKAPGQNCP